MEKIKSQKNRIITIKFIVIYLFYILRLIYTFVDNTGKNRTPFKKKTMLIELRKLKIASFLSQETIAFAADIYVDGKHVGCADNQGHGGNTNYGALNTDAARLAIKNAEQYALTLPPTICSFNDSATGKPFECPTTLESIIDDLVSAEEEKKERAKFENKKQKAMLTGIVVSEGNDYQYGTYKLNKGCTIESVLALPEGKKRIQAMVDRIIPQLKGGQKILNTNLGADIKIAYIW